MNNKKEILELLDQLQTALDKTDLTYVRAFGELQNIVINGVTDHAEGENR